MSLIDKLKKLLDEIRFSYPNFEDKEKVNSPTGEICSYAKICLLYTPTHVCVGNYKSCGLYKGRRLRE